MSQPASILSIFPEYNFRSTSVYNKRAPGRKRMLILFFLLGVIIGLCTVLPLILYIWQNVNILPGSDIEFIICSMIALIYTIIVVLLIISWYKKGIHSSLFADYIQSKGRMRFFVKNGKFGLVKGFNYKIIIPAMYDKLMWVQENEVIKATLLGEDFLIDIHNNKLN